MDQVLKSDRLLTSEDAARLQAIAESEFRRAGTGKRFSTSDLPNEFDLLPHPLQTKGGGTAGRFLQLEVADPLRTEVLCYLATRDTLFWLDQHYPQQWLSDIANRHGEFENAAQYGGAMRADYIVEALTRTTAERELACLRSRHPDRVRDVEKLIASIQEDEVSAFRKALKLDLWEYPNRS